MNWFGFILITLFFFSDQEKEYIIQDIDEKLISPVTVKQLQLLNAQTEKRRLEKTMGKYVPEVNIVNLNSDSVELSSLISKYTLISFSDPRCAPGSEYIQDIFPEISECNVYNDSIDFVLLVEIDSVKIISSAEKREYMDRQFYWYRETDMIYYILPNEAQKLNLFVSPSHLIVNPKGKVVFYGSGAYPVDYWLPLIDSMTGFKN